MKKVELQNCVQRTYTVYVYELCILHLGINYAFSSMHVPRERRAEPLQGLQSTYNIVRHLLDRLRLQHPKSHGSELRESENLELSVKFCS